MLPDKRIVRSRWMALVVVLAMALLTPGCSHLSGKLLSDSLDSKSRREQRIAEQVKKDPFPTAAQSGI